MNDYSITILTFIAIQAIVACGLNVIVGYAGQISLGHAAFFGIGAYSSALLTTKAGLTFWTALPLVILLTGAIGLVLGMPSLRLREDFLAVTTIGINFIVESVFLYVPFFGGALGLGGIPSITLLGTRLRGPNFLYLCLAFLAVVLFLSRRFTRSWGGLACFALREEETAASSMGVSPIRFKLLAFVIGTAMAGLGGALYAHLMRFISATDFGFTLSVSMMSMVVLGGIGTLWGPVLGALILGVLPEVFRPLIDYRMLLNAAILLLMIRFQPAGLLGEGSLLRRLFRPGRDSAHE
ncbi:branched-chain amino acid transport system permease protein [Aminivibrio pyruvatiphilus]|uniref:Branched-chain amino acid transport system permease protein n=1 Tax=Aminivibrio pyruvatiphilus TaxID=1005740 RepID=A0A4V3HGD6_9BACT|nr:branched-chain amino acid ABC transporter permease [Aminivibrio pyruvatiphilus]TDY60861.1 branched-chain amino acid transport system permease protein [Aminivibrio pyruvatiphilus]